MNATPAASVAAPLWQGHDVIAAVGGDAAAINTAWVATGVSIDTRTLQPGDLFVALVGPNFDAHEFVNAAFKKGAAAALVSQDRFPALQAALSDGAPLIPVADTLAGLRALAIAARARCTGRIVGVTGSVGKTSSKEALRQILGGFGSCYASGASLNNHWGVPLSLARLPADSDFGVFEMGMNHAGEITPLTAMVRPHVALITAIAAAHIGFFDSVADIAHAKAEIFSGLEPGGQAVIPADTPHSGLLENAARAADAARVLRFGHQENADVGLIDLQQSADDNAVQACINGREHHFRTGAPGQHMAMNALAVLGVCVVLGLDVERAAAAFHTVHALPGRGERQHIGNLVLLDESYNANAASVTAALDVLHQQRPNRHGRRIAILGDMLELGDAGVAEHLSLAPALAAAEVDLLYACGPLMRNLYDAMPAAHRGAHRDTAKDLLDVVVDAIAKDDVVLVKGSLSMGMAPIVAAVQHRAEKLAKQEGTADAV